jgi:hypothetical protein
MDYKRRTFAIAVHIAHQNDGRSTPLFRRGPAAVSGKIQISVNVITPAHE